MAAPPIIPLPAPQLTTTVLSLSSKLVTSNIVNTSDPRFNSFEWGLGYSGSTDPFLVGTLQQILDYINSNPNQYIVILYGYSSSGGGYSAASYQYVVSGCPPVDELVVLTREDLLKFDKNYEIKGATFTFYIRNYEPVDESIPGIPCQNEPGTSPISYALKLGSGGVTYDRINSYVQRAMYTSIGLKTISLSATNPYGKTDSQIRYQIIDYPTGGISAYDSSLLYGITNGYAQRGSTLLFTGNVSYFGGHSLSDIDFQWKISGITYYGQTLMYNFSSGGTYIVGLTLMSKIVGSAQTGITSEFYIGNPEIPDFYYDPIVGITAGRSITFGVLSSTLEYGSDKPKLIDEISEISPDELPEEFI
jgi:hypothetical protein